MTAHCNPKHIVQLPKKPLGAVLYIFPPQHASQNGTKIEVFVSSRADLCQNSKKSENCSLKGAKKLIGTHDFSTFRASNCAAKSPVRTMKKVKITKVKNVIKIQFVSKSFLKSQVRSMVGSLKYLGEKKWNLKKFTSIFKSKSRKNCAPIAPAHGLYLEKIIY